MLPTHVHRVRSLESGKESDVSIWKKRAEAAEKALVSKEREILDAREVVSPSSSSSYHCCSTALVVSEPCLLAPYAGQAPRGRDDCEAVRVRTTDSELLFAPSPHRQRLQ